MLPEDQAVRERKAAWERRSGEGRRRPIAEQRLTASGRWRLSQCHSHR